ncbi:MAG TPA: Trm112 family protein [Tepidisphaeraceae bacterium]|nr:Trm112 family protein [Tepidisphaeraceae bacterium]
MTDAPTPTSNTIDPELLSILRCPLTRSALRQEGDFLVAEIGGLAYPVRDGIPVMLVEEARLPQGVGSLDEFKQRYRDQIPQ